MRVGNKLSGALPEELGNLSNLEVLILNKNQLSGALPQSLTGLMKLMSFSFGDNMGLCAHLIWSFRRGYRALQTPMARIANKGKLEV